MEGGFGNDGAILVNAFNSSDSNFKRAASRSSLVSGSDVSPSAVQTSCCCGVKGSIVCLGSYRFDLFLDIEQNIIFFVNV